jgi:hypothetical protein
MLLEYMSAIVYQMVRRWRDASNNPVARTSGTKWARETREISKLMEATEEYQDSP